MVTTEPIMALGGFGGWDSILSTTELKKLVDSGVVRYFILQDSNNKGQDANISLEEWIKSNGVLVSEELWKDNTAISNSNTNNPGPQNRNNSIQLYDLKPKSN